MSVRELLDPVACHARLACSLSLGAAHKASLRLLTTTAPNASFLHGPLANGAAGENNQNLPEPTVQSPSQRLPAHAIYR